jgi:hypothetical protein
MPFILNPYWESSLSVKETAFIFANPPPNTYQIAEGPFLLGWRYRSDFDKTVEQIGVYESSPNQNSVGIWEWDVPGDTYTLMYQFIHDTSNPHINENLYNWYSIPSPLTFLANRYYVIAAMWGEEPVPCQLVPGDFILSPGSGSSIGLSAFNLESRPLDTDLSDPPFTPYESRAGPLEKAFFTTNLKLTRTLAP